MCWTVFPLTCARGFDAIAARAIAGSDLLKCAVYGKDYNPGRIFAAVGATAAKINPDRMKADMKFGDKETLVSCDLGVGRAKAEAWGCDLTESQPRTPTGRP